jgi:hypothetical protein
MSESRSSALFARLRNAMTKQLNIVLAAASNCFVIDAALVPEAFPKG